MELIHLTTRTLVLLRHARSGYPDGVRDHDRPLTDDGRVTAAQAGEWLRAHLDPVDQALCSTAVRAQQTAAATGTTAAVRSEPDLYEAEPEDLLRLIRATEASVGTLLVVGHAPGIPAAAAALTAADDPAVDGWQTRFPTAAMAVLQFDGDWADLAEGTAALAFYRVPPD